MLNENHQNHQDFSVNINVYNELMEKVGNDGRYQWYVYLIIFAIWIVNGILVFSLTFLYYNPPFDCTTLNISQLQCEQFICSHFSQPQRKKFISEKIFESIATEFGPFYCSQTSTLGIIKSVRFWGTIVSVLVLMFTEEKIGKRMMLLLTISAACIGSLVLFFSKSMTFVVIGEFVLGLGIYAPLRFGVAIISDMTNQTLSEKFIGLLSVGPILGGFITSLVFSSVKNWRTVIFFFYFLPYVSILIVVFFVFEENLRYLLKKGHPQEIVLSLRKIAKINNIDVRIQEEDILSFIVSERSYQKNQLGPIDLLRYDSVRAPTIVYWMMSFLIDMLYFGHTIIIGEFGFNPTLNQTLLSISELISLIILGFTIEKLRRKTSGIIMNLGGIVTALILVFMKVPVNCERCTEVFLQVIFIMIQRFCLAFQISLFFVSQSEFYPTSIKSAGVSTIALMGGCGSALAQVVMGWIKETKISPFAIMGICFLLMLGTNGWIPETFGCQLRDHLPEEKKEKEEIKSDSF